MTDIKLDQQGGHWIVVDASVLKLAGADIMVDSPARRGSRPGHRRALVHDHNDGLTINYNRDYTGGVTIENARVRLRVNRGRDLPKKGTIGELYLMEETQRIDNIPSLIKTSLWICVSTLNVRLDGAATWQEIPLGQTKVGTK